MERLNPLDEQNPLRVLQEEARLRAESMVLARGDWPCHKGCDTCCRRLASSPRVTQPEWLLISDAITHLPAPARAVVVQRIGDSREAPRPVTCPLLDLESGACLIYEARPVACRTYGFYAERDAVLGCHEIEALGRGIADLIWGNHVPIERGLKALGESKELAEWLEGDRPQTG